MTLLRFPRSLLDPSEEQAMREIDVRIAALEETLRECEVYLEDLADAEYSPGDASPTGNEAMRLLMAIRAALRT